MTQSWSPIGQGKALLQDETVGRIAARLSRSPAQVVIAWHLTKGYSAIPKAASAEHLRENVAAQEITLGEADMAAVDALDAGARLGPDPRSF